MRLALIVEYEGTSYNGFQYQANAPSVQEELEKAIAKLTGENVRVKGAGRTDAGVHARGQVVAFDTASAHPPATFVSALNYYLPDDIAVKAAHRVGDGFDPRRHALSRRYRYTVLNSRTPSPLMRRFAYHVSEPLDLGAMQEAAGCFVGTHDFARFAGSTGDRRTSMVRHIFQARASKDGEVVMFDVEGNAFLPQQVRRMAGALVDIGRNRLSIDDLKSMIDGGSAPDGIGAHTLPPQGLCLLEVRYAQFPLKDGESDDDKR